MKRMLCIDAHNSGRETLKAAAEQAGYEVLTAVTGRQALEVFASEDIAGVLLDPQLPDVDGVALSRELERMKPDVPVLVYSGSEADGPHIALRCMDAYIRNPAPPDAVLARAARALPRTHT